MAHYRSTFFAVLTFRIGIFASGLALGAEPGSFAVLPPPADPLHIQVASGFKVEVIYTVPKEEQGSWVCLTVDARGRLIAGDQHGGLYRITVPPVGTSGPAKVEPLVTKVGGAHGLLYAFDSLYVMVNERKAENGLWRLRDTNGDDQFDEEQFLREIKGSGEHGPHALVLGPDAKHIYVVCGNGTALPTGIEKSRPAAWGEDILLPRIWDPRGSFNNKRVPAGYVARTDPEGKEFELISMGFRNAYDIAIDLNGELFAFDSDSEGDQGTPWYVPTRINHAIDGADFGWRGGSGRWPVYYTDSLPGVTDIGPGSPTGVTFGTDAKFPAKYQRALFAADWTYGTLYAVHLVPEGASFRAEKEEFLVGKPLPLTDLVINPHDGAMYFTIGGRRTQAALYRVTYVGHETTAPAGVPAPTREAKLRRSLEALQIESTGPEAIGIAWPHLASPDRFIRFSARVVIEKQPASGWADRALAEKAPQAAIEALTALARVGDKTLQPRLFEALARLDFRNQSAALQLSLLRTWQLAFTRMGKPTADKCAEIAARFDPLFPHADPLVNRELVSLLIYLDSATVVAKTVPLLSVSEPAPSPTEARLVTLLARNETYGRVVHGVGDSRPDRQQIAYAHALRRATTGWTPKLRVDYFSWFTRAHPWKGGASFSLFLKAIRTEALGSVPEAAERASLDALSKDLPASFTTAALTPKGPGSAYTVDIATALVSGHLQKRNFARGKAMYATTACIACHHFKGQGGGTGPDLTGAGSRYSVRDLLENIIEPSLVISDEYRSEEIVLKNGSTLIGRVIGDENGELLVSANPFMPEEKTRVDIHTMKARKPYPVSMMPRGLINALNEEELRDLAAYILSGGNPEDKMFNAATGGVVAPSHQEDR